MVTIGRSGSLKDLRVTQDVLKQKGVSLHRVDRGGMATFHGPGQLVVYPIVKISDKDIHVFLKQLLDAAADVLKSYGLIPEFKEGKPGLWVNKAKIASVGLSVRNQVSYHGIALNVCTDPGWFDLIVPCGQKGGKITSMDHEMDCPVDIRNVKKRFVDYFCSRLGYTSHYLPHYTHHYASHHTPGHVSHYTPEHASHYTSGHPSHYIPGYASHHTSRKKAAIKPDRRPQWLVKPAIDPGAAERMEKQLKRLNLATVCQSAHCPNQGECFHRGTATFMILGTRCTRRCRFCAVDKGSPQSLDDGEPKRVAMAVQELGLTHAVVTSVTRDDLSDGGAGQFAGTIRLIRRHCSGVSVEVLVPDFNGHIPSMDAICAARPDVFNHNIETVPRLYAEVRPKAEYRRSLGVLSYAFSRGLFVKSGLMLGLGETEDEIKKTLMDLKYAGCALLTLGQYLAPSKDHLPVVRYVPPEEFDKWAETARAMGFSSVASGALVRSSYRAGEMLDASQGVLRT